MTRNSENILQRTATIFLLICGLVFMSQALAFGTKRAQEPISTPSPSPAPSVSPTPTETPQPGKLLVIRDPASGISASDSQPAIDLMNQCYSSGKLKALWLSHKFKSFNSVFEKSPKTNAEAWDAFVAGAPYSINLRWYFTRPSVIGYTFNFYNDSDESWKIGRSETRIFSNKNVVYYYSPKDKAAHWAHELSHQSRAGGFVHYTIHDGSTPYESGDIMSECVYTL